MMPSAQRRQISWPGKFRCAVRGVAWALLSERNFRVHLAVAGATVILASALGASRIEWCLLALCIATVLAAEMFNSAIEHLARAITSDENATIRDALDIGAGAVLVATLGAAAVGAVVFAHRLGALAEWW
jgi:diacylglycerol kinase